MSIIKYNNAPNPFQEMEELMKDFPLMKENHLLKSFVPAMDIYETEKDVIVEAPLAGVKIEDIEVSIEKGILSIQGQNKKEHEIDEKNYYRKEIRSGSFFRQITLPTPVVEEKINAEFENGILKITCPKKEKTTAKKISIKIK
ncbi:MAG: Hsp20/alpha crystallin family protein [Patescibacteria group bacterium]